MGWFGYTGQADIDVSENYTVIELKYGVCPRSGSITKVKTKFATAIGSVRIEIWRWDGDDCYLKIGESQQIVCEIGEHEYDLDTPITVKQNDLLAISGLAFREEICKNSPLLGEQVFTDGYYPTDTNKCGYGSAHDDWQKDDGYHLCVQAYIEDVEGEIIIDGEPYKCIAWRERQNCKVAVRSIPLRTTGSFVDTDTWTLRNRRLYITVRLTDAQKTTLQTTFDGHVEVTITAGDWTYTGWFVMKPLVYEYSKDGDGNEREWLAELEFALSSFSYNP